ncbi:MAG: hypothetical protein WBO48_21665, partial [Candidatus Promineifilaceae bacterium]
MRVDTQLAVEVRTAIESAQASGALPAFAIPEVLTERPREAANGDLSSPIAMRLAKMARMAPLKIAQIIADHLPTLPYVREVVVAPPGFINFWVATTFLQTQVEEILTEGMDYGRITLGTGQKAQVECVSANPTGPITLGRTRGGVMGDTLARAMRAAGYDVT